MAGAEDGNNEPSPRWWQVWWLPFAVPPVVFVTALALLGPLEGPPRCRDGWQSPSIGRPGACSWHGGVRRGGWSGVAAIALAGLSLYLAAGLQSGFVRRRETSFTTTPLTSPTQPPPPPQAKRPVLAPPGAIACPKCGSRMIARVARRGRRAGKAFWGCSTYPYCTGTRQFGID